MHSFVEATGDVLSHIKVGRLVIVFHVIGPLLFVGTSKLGDHPEQVRADLTLLHEAFVATLTSNFTKLFERQQSYDLRGLLGGTDGAFRALLSRQRNCVSCLMGAIRALPVPRATRAAAAAALAAERPTNALMALLLAGDLLVAWCAAPNATPHPVDVLLLCNLISSNQRLRELESLVPVCLPHFSPAGFCHAFVAPHAASGCVLVMVVGDSTPLPELQASRGRIFAAIEARDTAARLAERVKHPDYFASNVADCPELRHFVYRTPTSQITFSSMGPPYHTRVFRRHLLSLYARLRARAGAGPAAEATRAKDREVLLRTSTETAAAWVGRDAELYAVLAPATPPARVAAAGARVRVWLKRNEHTLFAMDLPEWR